MTLYIIIGIAVLLLLITAIFFNKFISYRNRIRNVWSDIDVQLKRRYSLIPNLVESVKGYAVHEKDLFENIAKYRSQAENATTLKEHEAAENNMISVLKNILVTVENYPALLANENFMKLQDSLIEVEDTIQDARRYYNAVVRDNNTAVESFPGNIFANIFRFKAADFFEIDSLEREVIKVEIKK